MKSLIVLSLLFVSPALASDNCSEETSQAEAKEMLIIKTDVPTYLKGAMIVVRLANGKETTVPAERFKVVPRKQQVIVTKVEVEKRVFCTMNEPSKNRASLVGGYGARNGLKTTTNGTTTTVETSSGMVGGLQYQRMLNDRLSIGVQGQTNNTGSLLLGLDF